MRLVIQRVSSASVAWTAPDGTAQENRIGHGLAILVGAGMSDTGHDARRLAEKVANLRIFADADGRTNRHLVDVGGEALVVSQFTLYGDLSRGRRPSFLGAGDPARAALMVDAFAAALADQRVVVRTGRFGADMLVSIANDGPVTFVISSDDWPTRV